MAHYQVSCGIAAPAFGQKLRLDPCHLPQSLCYKGPKSGALFAALLTERNIIIQKHDTIADPKSRLPQILSLRQFSGIAACKTAQSGETVFCLMLVHDNGDYCVPLLVSNNKDDLLMDWRLWADSYNLPMLIGEAPLSANGYINTASSFRPLSGAAACKMFMNDRPIQRRRREFSLRCRGFSLNTRLVLGNQVMLG